MRDRLPDDQAGHDAARGAGAGALAARHPPQRRVHPPAAGAGPRAAPGARALTYDPRARAPVRPRPPARAQPRPSLH